MAVVLALAAVLSGCATSVEASESGPGVNIKRPTGLDIADLRVASYSGRPYPVGASALVLARLTTTGPGDRLLSVSSSAATSAHLIGTDGQVVDAVPVPADRPVDLTARGPRILLTGLRQLVRAGDWIPLRLRFERAGVITTEVQRRVDSDGVYPRDPSPAPPPRLAGAR